MAPPLGHCRWLWPSRLLLWVGFGHSLWVPSDVLCSLLLQLLGSPLHFWLHSHRFGHWSLRDTLPVFSDFWNLTVSLPDPTMLAFCMCIKPVPSTRWSQHLSSAGKVTCSFHLVGIAEASQFLNGWAQWTESLKTNSLSAPCWVEDQGDLFSKQNVELQELFWALSRIPHQAQFILFWCCVSYLSSAKFSKFLPWATFKSFWII